MPDTPLPAHVAFRHTGAESLHVNGQGVPFDVLSFWQWSASDLVSNVTRGTLAEFIIATALGIDINVIRRDWDAYDLTTPRDSKSKSSRRPTYRAGIKPSCRTLCGARLEHEHGTLNLIVRMTSLDDKRTSMS